MFIDDEMKKKGRRGSGLSQFGMQLNALRGAMPGRSMFGIGSGGGLGNYATGFAFNKRPGMPAMPARPATGAVSAPPMPQAPQQPMMDFTESDFVPDIVSQVPPSQTSPVSQPSQSPVAAGPQAGGSQGPTFSTGQLPTGAGPGTPGMPNLPAWMTNPTWGNIPAGDMAQRMSQQYGVQLPNLPRGVRMDQFSGMGNIPRQ